MSALSDAIARSFTANEPSQPAVSPLRALGRRRLSGVDLLAQAVATTAPAASMVVLPMTMLRNVSPLAGVLTIAGATIVISLIALCITRFTRRQAAAGGLSSFAFQGAGTRAALVTGVAILVKYLGSAALTLYSGGRTVTVVLAQLGIDASGPGGTVAVYGGAAVVAAAVLVRGVRFAAIALLVVEVCSLLFIVAVTLLGTPGAVAAAPPPAAHGLLYVALAAMFALAGFESATFFGPEAKRPLVTVTRTVLFTPMICGALFVFAAWAAWTGRSATLADAYVSGVGPPGLVIALNLGLSCSWLASASASAHAASRLVYSMGVERLLPRFVTAVHSRYRTPHRALLVIVGTVLLGCAALLVSGSADTVRHIVRAMVVVAYVLVAWASIRLLARIGEQTRTALLAGWVTVGAGVSMLGYLVVAQLGAGNLVAPLVIGALLAAGLLWHRRLPAGSRVGVFDRAESIDVLPGAGRYARDADGELVLVGRNHLP